MDNFHAFAFTLFAGLLVFLAFLAFALFLFGLLNQAFVEVQDVVIDFGNPGIWIFR